MSVYFNVTEVGNRTDTVELNKNLILPSGSVIDEQDGYQVGVCRFKLPLQDIPLFRIYKDEYSIAIGCRGGAGVVNRLGNQESSFRKIIFATNRIFGGNCLQGVEKYGNYGIDPKYNNKPYVDIYSQEEFVELLNRGMAKSFSTFFTDSTQNATMRTTYTILNDRTGIGIGGGNTPITSLRQAPLVAITTVPTANQAGQGGYNGEIITDIKLTIKKMRTYTTSDPVASNMPTQVGSKFDFSTYDFFLVRWYGAKDTAGADSPFLGVIGDGRVIETYYFNNGILRGLSDFDGSTDVEKQILFSCDGSSDLDAQKMYDSTLYDKYSSNSENAAAFQMFPTETNISSLIGKRYDSLDPTLVATSPETVRYMIFCRNTSGLSKSGAGSISASTSNFTSVFLDAGDIKLEIFTTPCHVAKADTYQSPSNNNQQVIPQFGWDPNLNKIYLNNNRWWSQTFAPEIYMNDNLRRLLSFDAFKVYDVLTNDALKFISNINPDLRKNEKGVVYKFPSQLYRLDGISTNTNTLIMIPNATPSYNNTWYRSYESKDTRFARDMLDGIVVTSQSIATQGEIVGNGTATKRVITDFKCDPSSVQRDYLLYEPTGAIRYYPLMSRQALRDVDIQVSFEDLKGILRPLTVPPLCVASLKIEFRPNNMIEYH